MALLQREALLEAVRRSDMEERLVITPLLEESQIGHASIDLRLGTEFLILQRTLRAGVDPGSAELERQTQEIVQKLVIPFGTPMWLHPSQFVLGTTLEFLKLPNDLGGYVLGRSSWGRVGLMVATAIMVHPGFTGALTLELVNEGESPIALYPGLRIAQLAVHRLEAPTEHPYGKEGAKYLSPTGPEASGLGKEREEVKRIQRLGALLEGAEPPDQPAT